MVATLLSQKDATANFSSARSFNYRETVSMNRERLNNSMTKRERGGEKEREKNER